MKIHFGCDFKGMFCTLKTLFICIAVSETVKGKSLLESVSSVAQLCLTLSNPIYFSTSGFPVHHQLRLFKLVSIELVMPSNHLIFCHPLLLSPSIFPSTGSFQMSQLFASGGQSIGVSASGSVLPMNIQDWLPLGLTDLIFFQSKELSRIFSNTTV